MNFTIETYVSGTGWVWYDSSASEVGWFHPVPYDVVNWSPASPLPVGLYEWDVQVQDAYSGINYLSGQLGYQPQFQTVSTPNKISLASSPASPASGVTVPNPQVSLVSPAATDIYSTTSFAYHFQIAIDSSFSTGSGGSLIGDFNWLGGSATGGSTLAVPASWTDPLNSSNTQRLEYGQTYYWRVAASNGYDSDGDLLESAWSSPISFTVAAKPDLGTSSVWPMWSGGPLAVNEATGNLVLSPPVPSFPTAAGTLTAPITYNSHNSANVGLGSGWSVGPDGFVQLIDHNLNGDALQEIQLLSSDGSSTFFKRTGSNALVYLPTDGSSSQLTVDPGTGSTPAGYTLIGGDGSVETFGVPASGIATPTTLQTYSSHAGVGVLAYTFTSGKLTEIDANDGSTTIAKLYLYWHSLDSTDCPNALLCVVMNHDGTVWSYVGDPSGGGTTGNLQSVNEQAVGGASHALLKVTYSSGLPSALQNADDLASSSTHEVLIGYSSNQVTSVTEQNITGQAHSSVWSFAYSSCPLTGAPAECFSDATVDAHTGLAAGGTRLAAGYTKITPPCQQSGVVCANRTGGKYIEVLYDDAGQLLERTDPLCVHLDMSCNHAQTQYSPDGQLLWSEDRAGNPTDYAYDPVDQTLSSVTAPTDPATGTRPVTTYNYDETAIGSVSGSTYTPGTALQGVQAYYYGSTGFLNSNASTYGGRADTIETDASASGATLAFACGSGAPGMFSSCANTNYSVRYVGDINLSFSGAPRQFAFQTVAQGGTALVIDGQLVIDHLTATGLNTFKSQTNGSGFASVGVTLAPGKHRIALDYVENTTSSPSAQLGLQYECIDPTSCSGSPTTFTTVPASIMTPAWDNQTSTVSPAGRVSYSHFDQPWNGLAQYSELSAPVNGTSQPLVTSYGYDTFGRLVGKVLPNGNPTPAFSANGDLTSPPNAGSSNYGTTYGYYGDTETHATPAPLTGTSCPSSVTAYQLGLLKTVQQHGLHSIATVYDAAGRPVSVTKAAGTIVSCYDDQGRLIATQNTSTDTNPTVNTYDANGRLLTTSHTAASGDDIAGTVTNSYDEAGRLTTTVDANGAQESLSYDLDGNVTQRVADTTIFSSGTHPTTTYSYNDGDQLTAETNPAGKTYHFYYDSRGNLRGTQYPNGTFSWADTNPLGETTDVFNRHNLPGTSLAGSTSSAPGDTNPIADFRYHYNADGQKTQQIAAYGTTIAVAGGYYDSMSVRSDGTVWAWGWNAYGQLGNGTTTDSTTPVRVSGLSGAVAVSTGCYHGLALKSDGTVWAWGYGGYGELGNGSTANHSTPVQVSGLTGVVAISAGCVHSVAVKSDGTVWTWGDNSEGALGNGTTTNSSSPVQVTSLSGIVGVAAGEYHSLAVKSDGTVWAWGKNTYGELGNGSTTDSSTPVQVSGLSDITSVAAGAFHSLALRANGTVVSWGANSNGQLGNGTTTNSSTPVTVSSLTNVTELAGGFYHSVALTSSGSVWAWGYGGYGALGNGSSSDHTTPIKASTLTTATAISAGGINSIAATDDGSYWTWGDNTHGALGNATTTTALSPVEVDSTAPAAVAGGVYDSLMLKADGTVWATGYNQYGQLGNGTTTNSLTPVKVRGLTGVVAIAAGCYHSLALKSNGTVWAWGYGGYGALGNGSTASSSTPVQVSSLTGITAIAGGCLHSLALKSDGTVWAWGDNSSGALGNGTTTSSSSPVQVSSLGSVVGIAGGEYDSLAVKSDGTVWAWGYNGYGELGNGTTTSSSTPVQVSGLSGATQVASEEYSSYALKSDGTIRAWGWNGDGQLGNGTTTDSSTPVTVSGLSGITAIAAGFYQAAALTSIGTVYDWGYGGYGELGNGATANSSTPVEANITNATAIASGATHTLALTTDGTYHAWGDNVDGQLGNNSTTSNDNPVQMSGLQSFLSSPTSTTSYSYDSAGRLNTVTSSLGSSQLYCYDADSNRTYLMGDASDSCGTSDATATYTYATGTYTPVDALTSQTGPSRSYTYDGAGTSSGDGLITARGSDSFTYDGYGRIKTAAVAGNTVCYLYSPDGTLETRTYKTSASNCTTPTGTTNYLLGDLFETNATGAITTSYDTGPSGDLATYPGSPTTSVATYLYYDAHGNQIAQTNSTGTTTATQSFDPWGAPQTTPTANTTIHAYVGRWNKQYDTTTNLILMGARLYDPTLGRFLQVDPVDGGSLNNYDYAAQDPINSYDLAGTRDIHKPGSSVHSTPIVHSGPAINIKTAAPPQNRVLVTVGGAPTIAIVSTPTAPPLTTQLDSRVLDIGRRVGASLCCAVVVGAANPAVAAESPRVAAALQEASDLIEHAMEMFGHDEGAEQGVATQDTTDNSSG